MLNKLIGYEFKSTRRIFLPAYAVILLLSIVNGVCMLLTNSLDTISAPFGVLLDNGKNDEKIIAIPFADPTYNGYKDIYDLPAHIFDEMAHFFSVYKNLEGREAVAGDVNDRTAARFACRRARLAARSHLALPRARRRPALRQRGRAGV